MCWHDDDSHANHGCVELALTEGLWVGRAVATRQRAVLQHPQRVVVVTLAVTRPLVTLRVVLVHVHARVYRET